MKRLISGLSLAAALAGALTVTGAPMATGALTVAPVALTSSAAVPATATSSAVRGTVVNETDLTVKVTNHWCESPPMPPCNNPGPCSDKEIKELKPHKSTNDWGEDIDGYHVPPGYKFEVEYEQLGIKKDAEMFGEGWHKITDVTVARIKKYTH